jgi:hypothetical protein
LAFFFLLALAAPGSEAADLPQGFTVQGRLLDSSGSDPLLETVAIRFAIYDPSGTCLLYSEQQSGIDLESSLGVFALQVGSAVGSSQRRSDDPGLALKQIFANSSQVRSSDGASASATCAGGYTPGSGDARLLRVSIVREDGTVVQLTPDQTLLATPQASVAETLGGRTASDFVLQQNNVSAATLDALTGGADIGDGLHSHDSLYLRSGGSGNQSLGSGITYTVQGSLGIGTSSPSAQLGIAEQDPTRPAMVIQRSSSSQSAPVLEIRTEGAAPTALLSVSADGNITLHTATPALPAHLVTKGYVDAQLAAREPAFPTGTAAQYLRGDKSWATLNTASVPESGGLMYFTASRARQAFSVDEPLGYNVVTGQLTLSGLNGFGAANQMVGMRSDGTDLEYKTLEGTANQVTVNFDSSGNIVLGGPQNLDSTATPSFAGLGLGTASPQATLHVTGTLRFDGSASHPPGNNKVLVSDADGNARWDLFPTSNPGTVTSVTGAAGGPISVANPTTTPEISIQTASSTQAGVLSSADWNTFNSKENVLSFGLPLSRTGNLVELPRASSIDDGYLSAGDFSIFSAKQPAGNYIVSMTGDVTTGSFASGSVVATLANSGVTAGTYPKVTVDAKGRVTAGIASLSVSDLPVAGGVNSDVSGALDALSVERIRGRALASTAPSDQQVLLWNAGLSQWEPASISQSPWQVSSANLYYLSGNVGLGTSTPAEQLTLTGNLLFPNSTSTTGIIKQGTTTLLHTFGTANTFLGKGAGNLSLSGSGGNTGVGDAALSSLTTGAGNTALGASALSANQTGASNVAVGSQALQSATGSQNTAVGAESMSANLGGAGNAALGYRSLGANETGADNVAIGRGAGSANITGSGNVFIGPDAGGGASSGESGKLYIANSSSSTLIYGDFATGRVGLGTTAPTATLQVNGTLRFVDGSEGVNRVLMSDANGNASWASLPASGSVTSVSASLPLRVVNPTTAPALTIDTADSTTTGALSSTDWNTFNNKQSLIAPAVGTATDFYYRGDKTWADFATSARGALSASAPLSYSAATGVMSLLTVGADRGGTGLTSIGSANQVLGVKPDGSGLEYKSVSGTANQVTVSASSGGLAFSLPQDVGPASGVNFGSVTSLGDISGDIVDAASGFTVGGAAPAAGTYLRGNGTGFVGSAIQLGDLPGTVLSGSGSAGYLSRYSGASTLQSSSLFESSGSIGLGTASPERSLQIEGADSVAFLKSTGTGAGNSAMVILETAGSGSNFPQVRMNNGGRSWAIGVDPNDSQKFKVGYQATPSGTNGSGANVDTGTRMTIDSAGNIGVGTTSPSATLHVSGSLKLDLGTASDGQVLTFEGATGEAKWVNLPAAAGGVSSVSVSGLPLSVTNGTTNATIAIAQATSTAAGYLSSADWTTFNNKQPAGNYLTRITGDLTTSNATPSNGNVTGTLSNTGVTPGTYTKVAVDAKGRITSGTTLSLVDVPDLVGDVSGPLGATRVEAIQGMPVADTAPGAPAVSGDFNVLAWNPTANGGQWEPTVNRSSQWAPVSGAPSDLFFSSGKVGIGVSAPNEQLEIAGNFRLPATSATSGVILQGSDRMLHTAGTDNFFSGLLAGNLALTGSGNTGVGQSALTALTSGSDNVAIGNDAGGSLTTGSANVLLGSGAGAGFTTESQRLVIANSSGQSLVVGDFSADAGKGRAGIGWGSSSAAIDATLHVAGTLRVDGALRFPSGAADGKVLTSDASGNAVWSDLSAVGGVTSVTASAPVAVTGSSAVTISMPQSSGSQAGYLSSADWTTFNSKEPAITAGTASQYWKGDKTWGTFATDVRSSVSAAASSPLTYSSATGVFDLGTVPVTRGGTGLTATGSANQILGTASSSGSLEYKTLSGTVNQVTVTNSAGGITLSLPQDVDASSDVAFETVDAASGFKVGGAAAAGTYLRGDGTNFVASSIQQSDLPSGSVSGSGTTGRIAKYTGASTLGDSLLFEGASGVGIGTTSPSASLHVNGTLRFESASAANFKVLASDANGNASWQYFNQLDAATYNATASQAGLLSAADWTTFNSKQSSSLASGSIWVGNASGQAAAVALSGDATLANTGALTLAGSGVVAGQYTKVTVDSKGRVTSGTTLAAGDVPSAAGDVTGAYTGLTVVKLQGRDVASTAPSTSQVLAWSGTQWEPQTNMSSQWSNSSSDIYFSSGNVGIGTPPVDILDVLSVDGHSYRLTHNTGTVPNLLISASGLSAVSLSTGSHKGGGEGYDSRIAFDDQGSFGIYSDTNADLLAGSGGKSGVPRLVVDGSSGAVAIGTATPTEILTVVGGVGSKVRFQITGAGAGKFLKATAADGTAEWADLPSGGGVSSVSAAAGTPLSVTNGSTTPQISITQSSGSQAGYLSSADWTTFNSKEPAITAGTASQYWKGDKTWGTFATDVRSSVSAAASSPLTYSSATGVFDLGTVPVTRGGTGLTATGSANQLLGTASTSGSLEYKSLLGTSNQVSVNSSVAGQLTLSLPQSIGLTSSPSFTSLNLDDGLSIVSIDGMFLKNDGTGVFRPGEIDLIDLPTTLVRNSSSGSAGAIMTYSGTNTSAPSDSMSESRGMIGIVGGAASGFTPESPLHIRSVASGSGYSALNVDFESDHASKGDFAASFSTTVNTYGQSDGTSWRGGALVEGIRNNDNDDSGQILELIGLNVRSGHYFASDPGALTWEVYGIKLDMGQTQATIKNSYALYMGTTGSTNPDSGNWGIYSVDADQSHYFAGKVGLGTSSPSERLEVAGNIAPVTTNTQSVGTSVKRFSAMFTGTLDASGAITTSSNVVAAGNVLPNVDNTGTVGAAGRRWQAIYAQNGTIQTSDRRMKTDIRDSELGLEFLLGLRPVSYRWKDSTDRSEGAHYGVIAQELEEVLAGRSFGGLVYDRETDRYSVIYTEFISPLIQGVQELYDLIIGLSIGHDREIASLKAENARLKAESEAQAAALRDLATRVQRLEQPGVR